MEPSKRIFLNTGVQYARTIINMVVMLFSTRILLNYLGSEDYGLYSVVGSVVFMIGFLTTSLATSTQRFLSYAHGDKDICLLSGIFANAVFLHFSGGVLIAVSMCFLGPIFLESLTIDPARLEAAQYVYYMVLLMTLTSFVTSPIRALFIARENILYVSWVEVTDAVLKLIGTLSLPFIAFDSLKAYSFIMFLVSVFNLMVYAAFALCKYEECHFPKTSELSMELLKKLACFAVWNVYAVGSGVVRTQGLAIIINLFLGTVVNAAYGICLQVYNAVSFVAISLLNAMNPQLVKAEGAGDRKRMLLLSTKESKYSYIILLLLLVPLVFEMPSVLSFWLDKVPEHAVMFCRYTLIAYLWDQTTIGLTSANQAIGNIRNYSLLTSTTRLLTLPLAWFFLRHGFHVSSVMIAYLGVEVLIGMMRLPLLKKTGGLCVKNYCMDVYVRCAVPTVGVVFTAWFISKNFLFSYRFVVTELFSFVLGFALIYFAALTDSERKWINNLCTRKEK